MATHELLYRRESSNAVTRPMTTLRFSLMSFSAAAGADFPWFGFASSAVDSVLC